MRKIKACHLVTKMLAYSYRQGPGFDSRARQYFFFFSFFFLNFFFSLFFFFFWPLQPQNIKAGSISKAHFLPNSYSKGRPRLFASLEFPKFAWHHHQTLDP